MDRPLQWFICLLHMNELPLRHLIKYIDGETYSPHSFCGTIGNGLANCEAVSVAKFKRIPIQLPKIDSDLSTDQRYLYEMCLSINSSYVSPSLASRNPGKMCHSRWLTTANRILRLYVTKENPDEKLMFLTDYIIKVYAPVWFGIKKSPSCLSGPTHFQDLIRRTRYLPEALKAVVDPVIQRNSYFGHAENVVLAMLGDSRTDIRKLAVDYIVSSRNQASTGVRRFIVPTINMDASDYISLIDLGIYRFLEPPLTRQYTMHELQSFINDPEPFVRDTKYPCHTQAVERVIKLVTEAAAAVSGQERRDGYIRATLKNRSIMPVFETKKNFVLT